MPSPTREHVLALIAQIEAWRDTVARVDQTELFPCPRCCAAPGVSCKTSKGNPVFDARALHLARVAKARGERLPAEPHSCHGPRTDKLLSALAGCSPTLLRQDLDHYSPREVLAAVERSALYRQLVAHGTGVGGENSAQPTKAHWPRACRSGIGRFFSAVDTVDAVDTTVDARRGTP